MSPDPVASVKPPSVWKAWAPWLAGAGLGWLLYTADKANEQAKGDPLAADGVDTFVVVGPRASGSLGPQNRRHLLLLPDVLQIEGPNCLMPVMTMVVWSPSPGACAAARVRNFGPPQVVNLAIADAVEEAATCIPPFAYGEALELSLLTRAQDMSTLATEVLRRRGLDMTLQIRLVPGRETLGSRCVAPAHETSGGLI